MKKTVKWFFLLSKRLYKKISFVAVLVLIPLCVLAFRFTAMEDSGFVHIMLAQEDSDGVSSQLITSLQDSSSILQFTLAQSPQAAIEAVERAQADEAWIFPQDPETAVQKWVEGKRDYVVRIVTKEQDTTLQLAREKISQALYRSCARAYYLDYIRSQLSQLDHVTDADLIAYFESADVDGDFFTHENAVDGTKASSKSNYLTSPIRGLLGILVLLSGLAATMYYMQDEAAGTFSYVRENRRGLVALGCVMTAVINVSAVALLSLCISSLAGGWLRELGVLLLYALSCGAFGILLKQIFPRIRTYAVVLPLLTVVMLGLCPVFLDFRKLRLLQMLFPPTYYVNAVFDSKYLAYMALFSVGCLALSWLIRWLKTLVKNHIL